MPGTIVTDGEKVGILVEVLSNEMYMVIVGADMLLMKNITVAEISDRDLCRNCTHHRLWHHGGTRCGNACHCNSYVEQSAGVA
jgi:hypothetical protein